MVTQIGTVTIEYNQDGTVADSNFKSTMELPMDTELTDELRQIECCDDEETIKHNASLVLSSFFNRVNKIELRDVATTSLKADIDELEKFEDGRIKKAIISYSFDDQK